ncbi:flagellar biosynthetic protein FliR [Buchnera aphidicola (Pseudoregma panicola)]|uniref:flagellar biosynthetic protein FliR n=1 Tax=Buchnera aphidicola TaxID=9 RepID=UPI0031B846E8
MINFNFYEIFNLINKLIFPFSRILSILIMVPVFGEKFLNKRAKILFSIFLSFLYIKFYKIENYINLFSNYGLLILLKQIFIGFFFGFIIQSIFSISIIIGEILSSQIGLSFSTIFDVSQKWNSSIFSYFIKIFILMTFLSMDGHFWIIYTIFNSFLLIPIENLKFSKKIFFLIFYFFANIFYNGILIILPIIILILALNIMMAILNRTIPQLSVFSIFLPILLLISLLILYFYIPININNFVFFLRDSFEKVNNLKQNLIFYKF